VGLRFSDRPADVTATCSAAPVEWPAIEVPIYHFGVDDETVRLNDYAAAGSLYPSQSHMAGALRKKAIRIGCTDLIAMWG
jgi:hypothetical protein